MPHFNSHVTSLNFEGWKPEDMARPSEHYALCLSVAVELHNLLAVLATATVDVLTLKANDSPSAQHFVHIKYPGAVGQSRPS